MSTSLKVVNIAVSFLTATNRSPIFLRSEDIFWRRTSRVPPIAGAVAAAWGAGADFA